MNPPVTNGTISIQNHVQNEMPEFVDCLLRSNEYDGADYRVVRGGQSQLVFLNHKEYGRVIVKVMDSSAILRLIEGQMDQNQLQQLKNQGAKWTAREVANALVVQGHPNVVAVKEAGYIGPEGHSHKYFTITMEQANSDLSIEIKGQYHEGMLEENARDIFQQLSYAVHHLHSEGIMHRDIKSSNCLLFLCREIGLVVKLSDFGLSKSKIDSECVTKAGTLPFAAPELIFGDGVYDGYKVDVWSLGVVLYQILHGQCPFGDQCRSEIRRRIQEPVQFPNQHVNPQAIDLIRKMLDWNPTTRIDMVGVINHPWVNQQFYNSTAYKLEKFYKFIDPRALKFQKFQNPQERQQLMSEVMERFQMRIAEVQQQYQQQEQQQYQQQEQQQQVPPQDLVATLQNQMQVSEPYTAEQLVQQEMLAAESENDPLVLGSAHNLMDIILSDDSFPDIDKIIEQL